MIIIETSKRHVNRRGDLVTGMTDLCSTDPMYEKGFRFKDDQDRTYKENGRFNIHDDESKYDIIKKLQ